MSKRIKVRGYRNIPAKIYDQIWDKFTFATGELRFALSERRMVRVFIAYGKHKEILGWSGVYKSRNFDFIYLYHYMCVGVFVSGRHRHNGIGNKLRRMGLIWAMHKGYEVKWYNAKRAWEDQFAHVGDERLNFLQNDRLLIARKTKRRMQLAA